MQRYQCRIYLWKYEKFNLKYKHQMLYVMSNCIYISLALSCSRLFTSYQWLRHYTCSGFCKTSYHLLISPPPTNLPNTLKIHTGENKIDCQSRMWRQYTCFFPANGSTKSDVFQSKTFPIPRRIIPQISACCGFLIARCQETSKLTDYVSDRLVLSRELLCNKTCYYQYT